MSQEGSDEVGDCRLLVLEIQIEECKLANYSISGKREREPIHNRGEKLSRFLRRKVLSLIGNRTRL